MFRGIERRYGLSLSERILEETYSESTFWHPHYNFIFHIPRMMSLADQEGFRAETLSAWVHAAHLAGSTETLEALQTLEYETDLASALERNGYQTKHGRFPLEPPKPISEGQYEKLKPFEVLQLARTGETYWIEVWNQFELATFRVQRMKSYKPRTPKDSPKMPGV